MLHIIFSVRCYEVAILKKLRNVGQRVSHIPVAYERGNGSPESDVKGRIVNEGKL